MYHDLFLGLIAVHRELVYRGLGSGSRRPHDTGVRLVDIRPNENETGMCTEQGQGLVSSTSLLRSVNHSTVDTSVDLQVPRVQSL